MEELNEYNITAQIIDKSDPNKQSILFNDSVYTSNIEQAAELFNKSYEDVYNILKIYSVYRVN